MSRKSDRTPNRRSTCSGRTRTTMHPTSRYSRSLPASSSSSSLSTCSTVKRSGAKRKRAGSSASSDDRLRSTGKSMLRGPPPRETDAPMPPRVPRLFDDDFFLPRYEATSLSASSTAPATSPRPRSTDRIDSPCAATSPRIPSDISLSRCTVASARWADWVSTWYDRPPGDASTDGTDSDGCFDAAGWAGGSGGSRAVASATRRA
mmetsp:Transcript_12311/g.38982  ORF Transcript_12311/g.38982 Transcript_12311/m.38982 type:complete len:205 (+) Transcript_12311:574-1188(+)